MLNVMVTRALRRRMVVVGVPVMMGRVPGWRVEHASMLVMVGRTLQQCLGVDDGASQDGSGDHDGQYRSKHQVSLTIIRRTGQVDS